MLSPVSLLVVAGVLAGVGGSSSSSSSSSAVCEIERVACLADTTCNACLSGPAPTDFCSQRYPSIFHDGSAGEGAGFDYCEATGATNCCSHETQEISNQCLTNSAAIAYWTCVMEEEGCLVDDMPCFDPVGGTAATLAPADPDVPITPAPSSTTPTPAVAPTPATPGTTTPPATPTPAEAPATPGTVNFASGAARTFGFPRPVVLLLGLVVASLFHQSIFSFDVL